MELIAYVMMGAFVLIWVVLLVKFLRVVSAGKQDSKTDQVDEEHDGL